MNQERNLDLSWNTILKIIFTGFIFYLFFLAKDILILVFFSVILAVLFEPAIKLFQKFKIRRLLATILVYLLFFLFFSLLVYFSATILVEETRIFIQTFPQVFEKFYSPFRLLGLKIFEDLQSFINFFQEWLLKASANIFSAIISVFGGIFAFLTIFIMAIFISLEEGAIEKFIYLLVPKKYEELVGNLWQKSCQKVAGWFGIRVLTCFLVGLMVFITCYLFDIEYAGIFALLAGFLDLIPVFGPFLAGIPIVFFAFANSWLEAFLVATVLILIQQIEGNILTPILTKRFIQAPPLVVLFSLLFGGKLFGFLGAIFAVPFSVIIFEIAKGFLTTRKFEESHE